MIRRMLESRRKMLRACKTKSYANGYSRLAPFHCDLSLGIRCFSSSRRQALIVAGCWASAAIFRAGYSGKWIVCWYVPKEPVPDCGSRPSLVQRRRSLDVIPSISSTTRGCSLCFLKTLSTASILASRSRRPPARCTGLDQVELDCEGKANPIGIWAVIRHAIFDCLAFLSSSCWRSQISSGRDYQNDSQRTHTNLKKTIGRK